MVLIDFLSAPLPLVVPCLSRERLMNLGGLTFGVCVCVLYHVSW